MPNPAAGSTRFWTDGARLVISAAMQFEAGAQPGRGAEGPFPPLDPRYPDLPMQKWFEYGVRRAFRGSPRLPRKRPARDSNCLMGSAAASRSSPAFATYMAQIAEVEVSQDGTVRVRRVVCAVDCGTVVNPTPSRRRSRVRSSLASRWPLYGEITLKDGRVEQTDFDTYPVPRINEAPPIGVHIVQSFAPPGGMGRNLGRRPRGH